MTALVSIGTIQLTETAASVSFENFTVRANLLCVINAYTDASGYITMKLNDYTGNDVRSNNQYYVRPTPSLAALNAAGGNGFAYLAWSATGDNSTTTPISSWIILPRGNGNNGAPRHCLHFTSAVRTATDTAGGFEYGAMEFPAAATDNSNSGQIQKITFRPASGNFRAGSSFHLYGYTG